MMGSTPPDASSPAPCTLQSIAILYASQTGNAEAIAERIRQRLTGAEGLLSASTKVHHVTCDEHTNVPFDPATMAVIWVTSTTGNGVLLCLALHA
jgi:flavodoxin